MSFEKVLQYALPAAAGLGAAFDPYGKVSQGLNQAVSMRSMLKGQEERQAARESAEERAQRDQEMQEQRQQWAAQQFDWANQQHRDIREDRAAFTMFKQDLRAASPRELWSSIDAAQSMSDLKAVRGQMEEKKAGRQIASALQSLDPSLPQEMISMVEANPSWGYALYQNLANQRNASPEEKLQAQYGGVIQSVKNMVDAGVLDMVDASTVVGSYAARVPGAAPPEWLTPEAVEEAKFVRGQKEAQPLVSKRANLYEEYRQQAEPIKMAFENMYKDVSFMKRPREMREMERQELNIQLQKLWRSYRLPELNAELEYYYPGESPEPFLIAPLPDEPRPEGGGSKVQVTNKDLDKARGKTTAARGRVPTRTKSGHEIDILDEYLINEVGAED
jgi:hypothetical protein